MSIFVTEMTIQVTRASLLMYLAYQTFFLPGSNLQVG
jgi:hypothetical protein